MASVVFPARGAGGEHDEGVDDQKGGGEQAGADGEGDGNPVGEQVLASSAGAVTTAMTVTRLPSAIVELVTAGVSPTTALASAWSAVGRRVWTVERAVPRRRLRATGGDVADCLRLPTTKPPVGVSTPIRSAPIWSYRQLGEPWRYAVRRRRGHDAESHRTLLLSLSVTNTSVSEYLS